MCWVVHIGCTRTSVRDAMQESSNYRVIDTLFSLAEAYLFMQLVELKVQTLVMLGCAGDAL